MPAIQRPIGDQDGTAATSPPAATEALASWQQQRLEQIRSSFSPPALLSRAELLDALNAVIRDSIATGAPALALLFDLNDFAEINAAWGPAGGDEVLAAAAARIASFASDKLSHGAAAIVGRLDADHFVIVLPEPASLEGVRLATAEFIRRLAQPFTVSGKSIGLSARAVILQIPVHGHSVTSVLGRAFRLLNGVARLKADGVAVSEAEPAHEASAAMLERDLATAISTDQLFIALQPKVEAKTGAVLGAEALARWQHPERGLLPPQAFVQVAEKSGLIFDLGLRVLRDACRAGNRLAEAGKPIGIAVNVSPIQLGHPDFLSRFLETVDREGIEPEMLEIELTETAAMMGGERINASLQALRRCGIGVAIDDFGTGFSNLASLSALPADTLKIDRSLVTAERDGKASALLGIAVQLGRTFGLKTVAEGVETTAQYERVNVLGCDLIQGYFTGRPVPAGDFAGYYLRK